MTTMHLIISVGRELGGYLPGWSWLRVSHEVAALLSAGATVSFEGLFGLEVLFPTVAPHFFPRWTSPKLLECPHDTATSFPQ